MDDRCRAGLVAAETPTPLKLAKLRQRRKLNPLLANGEVVAHRGRYHARVKDADVVRELIECVPIEVSGTPPLKPIEIFDALASDQDASALALDLLTRAVHVSES
jgi:hypothetical protein